MRSVLLSLAVGVATMAAAQDNYTPAPTFAGPHPAVVRVVVPENAGASYGSGALVAVNESSGLVVTNWHVVRDATGPIVVYFPDGFRSGAQLLRTDRDWDLAALAIRRPNVPPIALSSAAPRLGDELTIAGYGSGSYRAVTGRCTQYVSPGGNLPFEIIELSAPARQGDSGGPILNQRGELAGVLFGTAFGETNGSYCGRVRSFLATADGDFQRISAQAMLAQNAAANQAILAALPRAGGGDPAVRPSSAYAAPGMSPVTGMSASGMPQAGPPEPIGKAVTAPAGAGDFSRAAARASSPASCQRALPTTEQIKNVLALIGVVAVAYHALRMLGSAVG